MRLRLFIVLGIAIGSTVVWILLQSAISPIPPETVTKTLYSWYFSCLEQHTNNAESFPKICPFNTTHALSDRFAKSLASVSDDPILCNEGLPSKITLLKPYYDTHQRATVIVVLFIPHGESHIPVRLQRINNQWKITAIDCDLDGHID